MNKGIIKKYIPVTEYLKENWKKMTDAQIAFHFDMKRRAVRRLRYKLGLIRELEEVGDLTRKAVKRYRDPGKDMIKRERELRGEMPKSRGGRRERTEEELAALMFR